MPVLVVFKIDASTQGGTQHIIADSLDDAYNYVALVDWEDVRIERLGSAFYNQLAFSNIINDTVNWPAHGWDRIHSYYSEDVLRDYLGSFLNDRPEFEQYIEMLRWSDATDRWHVGEVYPRILQDWFSEDAELAYVCHVDAQFELADTEVRRGIVYSTEWSM